MKPVFDLGEGLTLALPELDDGEDGGAPGAAGFAYPTAGLQKGLLLLDGERELSAEGVGFGVPIVKRGPRAVFPGSAEIAVRPGDPPEVTLTYSMDRVERLGGNRGRSPLLRPLDEAREAFALLYRHAPLLRRPLLAASNGIRWLLHVKTRFERTTPLGTVTVTYSAGDHRGDLVVRADLSRLPASVTEIVLMNELGADSFDRFVDADGRDERGSAIGAWDQVRARNASFASTDHGVSFSLERDPDPGAPDARLYRGREVAKGRLAWAGFGYSLRPGPPTFTYVVHLDRTGARRRGSGPHARPEGRT